jgi:hypothetical protein
MSLRSRDKNKTVLDFQISFKEREHHLIFLHFGVECPFKNSPEVTFPQSFENKNLLGEHAPPPHPLPLPLLLGKKVS